MKVWIDPDASQISEAIKLSKDAAAKWIKDEDGTVYCWPSDTSTHGRMAKTLRVEKYEKGLYVLE
jgi:hypothetical protein